MPPKVNSNSCIGCGTCVTLCPMDVFEISDGKASVANPFSCVGCNACVLNCPEGAISFKRTK